MPAIDIYDIDAISEKDAEDALFQLVNVVKYFGAEDKDVKSDIAQILKLYAVNVRDTVEKELGL